MNICKLRFAAMLMMLWAQIGWAQISLGPYMQRVSTDRATVVWYTAKAVPGILKYGTASGQWLNTILKFFLDLSAAVSYILMVKRKL